MTIKKVINPLNDEPTYIAEGVVDKITYREKATQFGHTHQAGIAIDGDWINIALTVKDGYQPQVRFPKGLPGKQTYHNLDEGDTVKIIVKANEYNGKTYYSTTSSKINVLEKGDGGGSQNAPQKPQNGSQGYVANKPKDDTGIVAGNARTAAAAWIGRNPDEDFKASIRFFAEVSNKARKQVKENNSALSEFEVGVAVGQATVIAAQLCDSLNDVYDYIIEFVEDIVPYSVDVVKALNTPKAEEKPAAKVAANPAAKKTTAARKAAGKPATPAPVEDDDIPENAYTDMYDDIPF